MKGMGTTSDMAMSMNKRSSVEKVCKNGDVQDEWVKDNKSEMRLAKK